jgi:hypothetical protein
LATAADVLRDRFKPLLDEVEDLAKRATNAKNALTDGAIANDNERDPFIALGIEARKLAKRLGETKLATTKPLRDEVTETNRFFDTVILRPETIQSAFETIVGRYDAKKREEARVAAAEVARLAQEEAKRKLEEAAASSHSVLGDVLMQEAVDAEHKAAVLVNDAITAGSGPTRTEAGTVSAKRRGRTASRNPARSRWRSCVRTCRSTTSTSSSGPTSAPTRTRHRCPASRSSRTRRHHSAADRPAANRRPKR